MRNKRYITHDVFHTKVPTVLYVINYGDVVDGNKIKIISKNGEQIKTIDEIINSSTNVIGFDDIDFPGSLWKWDRQNNGKNKPYVMDETITDCELVTDQFWVCFNIMVKPTETEILYKPILL